jgi:hypothetical protein
MSAPTRTRSKCPNGYEPSSASITFGTKKHRCIDCSAPILQWSTEEQEKQCGIGSVHGGNVGWVQMNWGGKLLRCAECASGLYVLENAHKTS